MTRTGSGKRNEKRRIVIMAALVALCCALTYYFQVVIERSAIFGQFFYIPILLAALWWRRQGLVVAMFLVVLLVVSNTLLRKEATALDDYARAAMFAGVAVLVAMFGERIAKTQDKSARINTVLRAVRSINQLIAREKDRDKLLQGACKSLTETGCYSSAWIALLEEPGGLVKAAEAGSAHAFSPMAELLGRGELPECGRRALSRPGVVVTEVPAATCGDCPLTAKRDGRTAMTTRLECDGKMYGLLSVAGAPGITPDHEEQAMFGNAGGDIGHALRNIESEQERKRDEERLQHSLERLRAAMEGIVQAMAVAVEMRDPHTAGHQQRVRQLSRAIAEQLGLAEERVVALSMAALIHDIGKLYVPAGILRKQGDLTAGEFGLIKAHPQIGHDILSSIELPWPIADIILQHHERMDGSGYPAGISGEHIVLEARILAVADVIEAMSSHRAHRAVVGTPRALEYIRRHAGTRYDPDVVEACRRLFEEQRFAFQKPPELPLQQPGS